MGGQTGNKANLMLSSGTKSAGKDLENLDINLEEANSQLGGVPLEP